MLHKRLCPILTPKPWQIMAHQDIRSSHSMAVTAPPPPQMNRSSTIQNTPPHLPRNWKRWQETTRRGRGLHTLQQPNSIVTSTLSIWHQQEAAWHRSLTTNNFRCIICLCLRVLNPATRPLPTRRATKSEESLKGPPHRGPSFRPGDGTSTTRCQRQGTKGQARGQNPTYMRRGGKFSTPCSNVERRAWTQRCDVRWG